ncbi:SDR family oxidoreductase [Macrococcus lamae]|uniref:SDR family oxidoreductase n=1 Tax=Macrococcus lamae TaxID=198484 RepID=A0A4R6BSL4_9STAP|nr:SDR family oxidoreductase [Macrococcus lamae]TDM05169.1 SDR family oxidoreductase [Macrococcus lamae]
MNENLYPLLNKKVFITGVSRMRGIGYTVATECAKQGASVLIHHFEEHDANQEWGAEQLEGVFDGIKQHLVSGATFDHVHANFDEENAIDIIKQFLEKNGAIDYLVYNHALAGFDGPLKETTAEKLDKHWRINTRSSILMARIFLEQHHQAETGKIIFLTSGQSLGPMPNEISYALSKGALAEIVKSLASDLADSNITVNAVNPGVTNTGYLDEMESWQRDKKTFPFGRFSKPEDAANIITFLLSDKGSWITGQVINSEGGFRR